jgi:hypothetical protein
MQGELKTYYICSSLTIFSVWMSKARMAIDIKPDKATNVAKKTQQFTSFSTISARNSSMDSKSTTGRISMFVILFQSQNNRYMSPSLLPITGVSSIPSLGRVLMSSRAVMQ